MLYSLSKLHKLTNTRVRIAMNQAIEASRTTGLLVTPKPSEETPITC